MGTFKIRPQTLPSQTLLLTLPKQFTNHKLGARLGPPLLVESAMKQTASGLLVVLLDNKMLRSQGPIGRSSLLSRKESNGTTCTWGPTAWLSSPYQTYCISQYSMLLHSIILHTSAMISTSISTYIRTAEETATYLAMQKSQIETPKQKPSIEVLTLASQ